MKRAATQSNGRGDQKHALSFLPVFDSRKRKVPGLWQRGQRYYVQLRIDLGNGRTSPQRFALDASNLEEAKGELDRKRTQRRDGERPQTGHRPKFDDVARQYLDGPALAQKKEGTKANERQAIGRWSAHLGGVRVDKITRRSSTASGRSGRSAGHRRARSTWIASRCATCSSWRRRGDHRSSPGRQATQAKALAEKDAAHQRANRGVD